MWRIDKEWRGLRHNTPWIKRLPSEYMREHLRFTLQPMDAPPDPKQFLRMIGQLDSDNMLMFSTDYPHWQFDSPEEALPMGLPESLMKKILAENAREFYQL
jgi:predicted TIM-barrel fold metal-dependent hydrolase